LEQLRTFTELKKNLKKDFSGLLPVKIAVLGDTATQLLAQALRGCGYDNGLALEIWEAEFNQVHRQVFDNDSELYAFNPGVVIIFHSRINYLPGTITQINKQHLQKPNLR
jgi:predicted enzyme involved in methoxymalonyl-ACP biosynthesis